MEYKEEHGKKVTNLYDIVSKIVITIVAIINLFQDRSSPFPYILSFIVILVWIFPFLNKQFSKFQGMRKGKKILHLFFTDFCGYIKQAKPYLQHSSEHLSPFYLRNTLWKLNPSLGDFSSYLEGLLAGEYEKLNAQINGPVKDVRVFERISHDFSSLLSYFVLLYVDQVIREIKKEENKGKINSNEIAEIKKRYNDFVRFVGEYNGFRNKISACKKESEPTNLIRIPTQVLE